MVESVLRLLFERVPLQFRLVSALLVIKGLMIR